MTQREEFITPDRKFLDEFNALRDTDPCGSFLFDHEINPRPLLISELAEILKQPVNFVSNRLNFERPDRLALSVKRLTHSFEALHEALDDALNALSQFAKASEHEAKSSRTRGSASN